MYLTKIYFTIKTNISWKNSFEWWLVWLVNHSINRSIKMNCSNEPIRFNESFWTTRWQHPKLYLFHIFHHSFLLCVNKPSILANIALPFTQKYPSLTLQAIIYSCPALPFLWPSLDSISRTNSPHPAQTEDLRHNPQAVRVRPAVSLW